MNKKAMTKRKFTPLIIAGVIAALVSVLWFFYTTTEAGDRRTDSADTAGSLNPYNDTARFLAGMDIPETSPLNKIAVGKKYQMYKKQIDESWLKLQVPNQKKIENWKAAHLPKKFNDTIFYPFSGPDALNALIFFPDGEDYIMFGLESPGSIPQPQNETADKIFAGLRDLKISLNDVLCVNFFKTNDMKVDISTNEYNSITSVMMWFIARSDCRILNAKNIWIDGKGRVTEKSPESGEPRPVPGVEFIIEKNSDNKSRRIRYFQIDVSNTSLESNPHFLSYLEKQERFTTILKSASYLMYYSDRFNRIREFILAQSDFILQDDSGIPFKYFAPDAWSLTFHGFYDKPIPNFSLKYQPDFKEAMKKYTTGPLPFSYGYNYKKNESNLMLAERKK